jgi:DNA helicase HerA-like ATPase
MLRSLARQQGYDPDHLPAFAIPRDLSPSDFVFGTAMSGDVVGEEVGLAEVDLPSHVGVFGTTSSGKTTLVKLMLLDFTGKQT